MAVGFKAGQRGCAPCTTAVRWFAMSFSCQKRHGVMRAITSRKRARCTVLNTWSLQGERAAFGAAAARGPLCSTWAARGLSRLWAFPHSIFLWQMSLCSNLLGFLARGSARRPIPGLQREHQVSSLCGSALGCPSSLQRPTSSSLRGTKTMCGSREGVPSYSVPISFFAPETCKVRDTLFSAQRACLLYIFHWPAAAVSCSRTAKQLTPMSPPIYTPLPMGDF